MNRAIIYKEWIKTHLYVALSLVVWVGFTAYGILSIQRMMTFNGATAVWMAVQDQNNVLIDTLKYLPTLFALGLGLVQFIPEMQEKRLKLTLHLPVNQSMLMVKMLGYGAVILGVMYALQIGALSIYLHTILAEELVTRILATASLWYVAGWMIYLLSAWITVEPTWQRRVFNLLVGAGLMRLMFFNTYPQSYDTMWGWITLWSLALIALPIYSMDRFRRGCQD